MSTRSRTSRTTRSVRRRMLAGEGISPGRRPPTHRLRMVALFAALVLAAGWMSVTFGTADPVQVTSEVRSELSDDIDAFVTGRMQTHSIPGAAVAVVRGGEVVHVAGYGTADPEGQPATADTPFLIGSVSKSFTATAVLQLVEEGRLSLDDAVLPYVDGITDDMPAGFEDVTVEQLLTHTSGLAFLPGIAGHERIHEGDDALERRMDDVLARPLAAEPGAKFSYSNGGYSILAAVIEQVTGTSFDEHMRTRVFEPLGMTNSFASDLDSHAEDLATGHSRWFGRWRPRDLPFDRAGASMGYMGSTAADLTAFMQAHLGTDHADAVSSQLRDLAHSPAATDTGMQESRMTGYGMGWFTGELAGRPTVSHSGELGHFTSHVDLVRDDDRLGVAVLTNASASLAGQGANYSLGTDLTRLLDGQEVEPASPMVLTTGVLPFAVWATAIAILIGAGRYMLTLPRLRDSAPTGSGVRRWLRPVVVPALGYLAVAVPLLTVAPLGFARHFAPDVGWGLTAIGYLALAWAALRTPLAISATLRRKRTGTSPDAPTPSPEAQQATGHALSTG